MNSKITVQLAKATLVLINSISRFIPLYNFELIANFSGKLNNYCSYKSLGQSFFERDYYQGSENDLINIFLETLEICRFHSTMTREYIIKRLEFLANEGLTIANLQSSEIKSFKLFENEVTNIIKGKTQKQNKVVKISAKTKPSKKIRRNKLGQFMK